MCVCECCSSLLWDDSSVSSVRCFANLHLWETAVYTAEWRDRVRHSTHTHLPKAFAKLFPCVHKHTHTPHNIIWITANPVFIECFQSKCQASGTPLFLCACGAACHTGSFFSVVLFLYWLFGPPSWLTRPKRSAQPKATCCTTKRDQAQRVALMKTLQL